MHQNGKPSGKGFIQFKNAEDSENAKAADGADFGGHQIEVKLANEPREYHENKPQALPKKRGEETTVFVGGISYQSTKESIEELFKQCGEIKNVRVGIGEDGKSRGFAHVEFNSPESVPKALALTGQNLDGRNIRVDIAGAKRGGSRGGPSRGSFEGQRRGGFRRGKTFEEKII